MIPDATVTKSPRAKLPIVRMNNHDLRMDHVSQNPYFHTPIANAMMASQPITVSASQPIAWPLCRDVVIWRPARHADAVGGGRSSRGDDGASVRRESYALYELAGGNPRASSAPERRRFVRPPRPLDNGIHPRGARPVVEIQCTTTETIVSGPLMGPRPSCTRDGRPRHVARFRCGGSTAPKGEGAFSGGSR